MITQGGVLENGFILIYEAAFFCCSRILRELPAAGKVAGSRAGCTRSPPPCTSCGVVAGTFPFHGLRHGTRSRPLRLRLEGARLTFCASGGALFFFSPVVFARPLRYRAGRSPELRPFGSSCGINHLSPTFLFFLPASFH